MIRQRQSYPTRFHGGTSREAVEAGIRATDRLGVWWESKRSSYA